MPSLTDVRFAELVQDIACDVHSKTQDDDNILKVQEISRAFVSDTLTVPTKEMNAYALRASLGDDVYFEPSTALLESHIAKITGKEAGLFLPTGTILHIQSSQMHGPTYTGRFTCRLRNMFPTFASMEAGGAAFHSGANSIPIIPANEHHLTWEDIEPRIVSGTDVHVAPTHIIALENTLNGTIIPQDDVIEISKNAHSRGIIMHLDGARIWHVAAETGLSMKELCDPFESASLCLSKGLGAPIGTVLVGSAPFITKARWFRKLFGGGMRQTGYLAGCAAYALTYNFPMLPRVHALAKRMQQGLEQLGVGILSPAETCMLFYDPSPIGVEYWEVVERAAQLPDPIKLNGSRLLMHIQTSPQAIEDFLELLRTLKEEKAAAGWKPENAPPKKKTLFRDVYVKAVRPT
ncbi:pyridoxal phosphate-dependent transferase [Suillus subalutaceus]|uniref:pyridoxal phosphate-dependent transferase n=1 Tax=Suillus subalutaceus TaxID=48586 RepID=UPI001B872FA5|nr:pyridoxal phosphate-dependent transferase [Suillus subalutaceus]KAG1845501.1 pyridoxal phosphate-dependent transferase [Suillus subalutaceus]